MFEIFCFQKMKAKMQIRNILSSSPLSTVKFLIEEANVKAQRYSADERKERIDRYRAKRTKRNFNRTIKVTSFDLIKSNFMNYIFLEKNIVGIYG